MDKSDFALNEPAYEYLVTIPDRSCQRENFATLRMRPPAATNWLSNDDLDKRRHWPLRGFEYNTVLTNESERLA